MGTVTIERLLSRRDLVFNNAKESEKISVGGNAVGAVYLPPEFAGSSLTIEVDISEEGTHVPDWKPTGQDPIPAVAGQVTVLTPANYELPVRKIRLVSDAAAENFTTGIVFLGT